MIRTSRSVLRVARLMLTFVVLAMMGLIATPSPSAGAPVVQPSIPSEQALIMDDDSRLVPVTPAEYEPVPGYQKLNAHLVKVRGRADQDRGHFGGIELDATAHVIRVYVTNGSQKLRNAIGLLRAPVQFIDVKYTFDELIAARDKLAADSEWRRANDIPLATWGPDLATNRVRVGVPNLDASKLELLVARYGADHLMFEEEAAPVPAARLNETGGVMRGGARIYVAAPRGQARACLPS